MPKFAYVAITPDGSEVTGTRGARAATTAELALLRAAAARHPGHGEAEHPARSRSPARGSSARSSCTSPASSARSCGPGSRSSRRCTRSARRRRTPSVRRMMADIEDGLRARRALLGLPRPAPRRCSPTSTAASCARPSSPASSTPCSTSSPSYLERDLEARRKIKSALIYPVDRRGHVVRSPSSILAGLRAAAVRGLLRGASTPSCRCRPGCCSASPTSSASWWWALLGGIAAAGRCSCFADHPDRRRAVRARPAAAAGSRSRRDRPVRAGRAVLPDPRLDGRAPASPLPEALAVADRGAAQPGLHQAARPRCSEQMLEGEGLAGPLARTGLFPGDRDADDPRR